LLSHLSPNLPFTISSSTISSFIIDIKEIMFDQTTISEILSPKNDERDDDDGK